MADHGNKLPTTTLIASDYVRVRYSKRLGDVFHADTPAVHTLICFKAFWRAESLQPEKLRVALATVTLELGVGHGNLPTAYNGIEYIPDKYRLVIADRHYS